jgi:hypothetical protein
VPPTSRIPRLTHAQYDATIQDLLFIDATPSSMLAPETNGSMDQRAWDSYRLASEQLARQAFADATARAQIVGCDPATGEDACARALIESFGRRAFRRPLSSEEIARFEALWGMRGALTERGTFDEGAQLLVEAFLQAPSFLMRTERSTERAGGLIPLSDHEVAARLSYMLWDSMPDDVLLGAADRGELATDAQIRAQAERMLALPRARAQVASFHRRWMGIDGSDAARWTELTRDPERYPDFDPSTGASLRDETIQFIDHVVFDLEGGFGTLLTNPVAMVNRDVAALYGLDPGAYGTTFEPVPLDGAQRAGLLTRAGFLASHAMYDRTSPILRGAFIQKHMLCYPLGTPPPGAEMTPLPPPDPSLRTTRDRVALQTSADACAVCHESAINPVGFAFEHYDAIGRWRETENEAVIDASGTAPIGGSEVSFDGAIELSQHVAASPAAHLCYAGEWVEHAYRREPNSQDRCIAEDLAARLADESYTILDLLVDLTQTDSFANRAPEQSP